MKKLKTNIKYFMQLRQSPSMVGGPEKQGASVLGPPPKKGPGFSPGGPRASLIPAVGGERRRWWEF